MPTLEQPIKASSARPAETALPPLSKRAGFRFLISVLPLLPADPEVDPLFEEAERQRPVVEHRVVKLAYVEPVAQFSPRLRPQLLDLQLAQLVGERLARPHYVPVYLDDDVVFGL